MKISLLFVFVFSLLFPGFGQQEPGPLRVEFEARADVFELVPCGEKGVLLFYESIKVTEENSKAWVFIFYDKDFEPIWSKEINLLKGLAYIDFFIENDNLFLAFQKVEKARQDEYNFQVLNIDLSDSEYNLTNMFIPDKSEIIHFMTGAGMLVVALNFEKEESLLIIRDLISGTENTVKFSEYPTFAEDVRIDKNTRLIYLAANLYITRKESSLYLNSYDFTGNLLNSTMVTPPGPMQKLLNAQVYLMSDDEIFVLGSFNNLNGKISPAEDVTEGEISEGFYIAKMKGLSQEFIRFHNILDFENITSILNNEELAAVDDVMKKNQKKGKKRILNYNFLIHDLEKQGDNFVMLAEAYYPQYQQVSTMSYDFYGRPMPYYYTVFEGYRYFNAFVASFDIQGNLNWSNGIKIWETMTMRLYEKVDMFIDGSEVALFYNNNGKIVSKVIDGYNDIGDTENTKILSQHNQDVLMETTSGAIRHWYGNNFLAYGYQTLKNNALGGGSKRHVFYFNKLAFD